MSALKTREQIYRGEASDLLRNITMYKTLTDGQINRLYPGQEAVIQNLISYLSRRGRIYRNGRERRVSVNAYCDARIDSGLLSAVWVLCDFIDRAEYHYSCDFPVKLCFFADGELYEVVYVPYEQEMLMNHALSAATETDARRIVLVERAEQINLIDIPNATGFCSVNTDGTVRYYKLE